MAFRGGKSLFRPLTLIDGGDDVLPAPPSAPDPAPAPNRTVPISGPPPLLPSSDSISEIKSVSAFGPVPVPALTLPPPKITSTLMEGESGL